MILPDPPVTTERLPSFSQSATSEVIHRVISVDHRKSWLIEICILWAEHTHFGLSNQQSSKFAEKNWQLTKNQKEIQRDVKRKSSRCCFHQIRYRQASLCARPMDYCHGKPAFGPPRWASLQLSLVNVIYFFPARAQIQTSLWSSNDLQLGQRGRIFWLLWWRWRRS